jgi:glutathione synthase/RimK-type ligase-like ATP-grasp enzyme
MNKQIWIYTGGRLSNGAKALCSFPGFLRLKSNKFYKVLEKDIVVNWGVTSHFMVGKNIKNLSSEVKIACNKLETFKTLAFSNISTVDWTTKPEFAKNWNSTVVVRNKLTGHSGDGIVIVEKDEPIPIAPLYTRYIYKVVEYRVHVVNGKVIDTCKKIRDPARTPTDWKVRSHKNGFIFTRNSVIPNIGRNQIAINTIEALDLDFGAVDIIEDKNGKFYVLEVNTAPGLEGKTVELYAEAFRGLAV